MAVARVAGAARGEMQVQGARPHSTLCYQHRRSLIEGQIDGQPTMLYPATLSGTASLPPFLRGQREHPLAGSISSREHRFAGFMPSRALGVGIHDINVFASCAEKGWADPRPSSR